MALGTGEVIEGRLPGKAARLVKEWCLEHEAELADDWRRAQALLPLRRIAGADND